MQIDVMYVSFSIIRPQVLVLYTYEAQSRSVIYNILGGLLTPTKKPQQEYIYIYRPLALKSYARLKTYLPTYVETYVCIAVGNLIYIDVYHSFFR